VSETEFHDWIRPVSVRATQEISKRERRYPNREEPRLLDIIDLPLSSPKPHAHQTENHLIEAKWRWVKVGECEWPQLWEAEDDPESLWGVGWSSHYGLNDRVPADRAHQFPCSLLLIRPEHLVLRVAVEGQEFPRRRVRAEFPYRDVRHIFPVTDPTIEAQYLDGDDGEFAIADAFLSVSLGEAHTDNYCYKFCAAVFLP
jgi:hypothetical protein